MRAACVSLLNDYAADAEKVINVLPSRPTKAVAVLPFAFVDTITESVDYTAQLRQREPTADVIVLHGPFDKPGSAALADTFADGFLDWVTDNIRAAGTNTSIAVVRITDEPDFTVTWLDEPRTYYATRIEMLGRDLSGGP